MEQLNQLSLFLATLLTMAVSPTTVVSAQQVPSCLELYNGGVACKTSAVIAVDKTIQNPQDGRFEDFLEQNQTKIQPGNSVIFRVTIRNTSNKTLEDIRFTDAFSEALTFTESQKGTYNASQGTLTYTIGSLDKGDAETFDIQAKVRTANELPNVTGPLCVTNIVSVKTDKEEATDNVQFCIEKKAQAPSGQTGLLPSPTPTPSGQPGTTKGGQPLYPAPQTQTSPDTGPELLGLVGLIPAGLAGFYLRKKSSTTNTEPHRTKTRN